MTLVDSNRMIHIDLKPSKKLITQMVDENLIFTEDTYHKREYMELFGNNVPIPFVYTYMVTEKGNAFYFDNKPSKIV